MPRSCYLYRDCEGCGSDPDSISNRHNRKDPYIQLFKSKDGIRECNVYDFEEKSDSTKNVLIKIFGDFEEYDDFFLTFEL